MASCHRELLNLAEQNLENLEEAIRLNDFGAVHPGVADAGFCALSACTILKLKPRFIVAINVDAPGKGIGAVGLLTALNNGYVELTNYGVCTAFKDKGLTILHTTKEDVQELVYILGTGDDAYEKFPEIDSALICFLGTTACQTLHSWVWDGDSPGDAWKGVGKSKKPKRWDNVISYMLRHERRLAPVASACTKCAWYDEDVAIDWNMLEGTSGVNPTQYVHGSACIAECAGVAIKAIYTEQAECAQNTSASPVTYSSSSTLTPGGGGIRPDITDLIMILNRKRVVSDGQAGQYSRGAIFGKNIRIERSLELLIEILHSKKLLTDRETREYNGDNVGGIYSKKIVQSLVNALVRKNKITLGDIALQLSRPRITN